jgi:hypothetical protein
MIAVTARSHANLKIGWLRGSSCASNPPPPLSSEVRRPLRGCHDDLDRIVSWRHRERADAGKAGIGGRSGKLNKDGTFSA